jgi:hypothetical protein
MKPPGRLLLELLSLIVYSKMRILPCCFNVDGLNSDRLEELKSADPQIVRKLIGAAKQSDPSVVYGLAQRRKGVSRSTAILICDYLRSHHAELTDWQVRAEPGGKLGTKAAVDDERIDEALI